MGAAGGPMDLVALAQTTRLASQELARSSGASRNRALEELARYLEARWDELHLIRLLEEGKIPYRKVGSHRRVLAREVLAYRETSRQQGRELLDQLIDESQALGLDRSHAGD
jgi:acyl-CoA reductase-like NAD-dependent aldehyde dehydrogenase